jgi:hypothetical protein
MTITKIRTIIATLAATFAVAVSLVPATAAQAQPKGGTNQPKGCPVEDEHGNVTYVDPGTRIGLFVCGDDGDWHFGWLINGRVVKPTKTIGTVAPPASIAQSVDR